MAPNQNKNKEKEQSKKRKNASFKTKLINGKTFEKMDWSRIKAEQELAKEGLLADGNMPVITKEGALIPVWDLKKYAFLQSEDIPDTVNPKLWVQGNINLNNGLFQVSDRIYQVRGFDAANMTLIKGNTGWIVIDCLTCEETADAAFEFINGYFGKIPVSAVIITHSHTDHYGGILAAINRFINQDVVIYVPQNFASHVIEENVTAGLAMSRRGVYMYGTVLPRDEKGQIDIGIGKGISIGTVTFTQNVKEISRKHEMHMVDGIAMEFQLALNTEAPSEMFVYIPREKSLCIAEDCNATLHNLLTLRGANIRDPIAWAKSIQDAINSWGGRLTSVFGVHNWPRFGNEACIDYLEKQRDLYQYINDQTLRLINKGYTIEDVGRMVKLPESLEAEWYNSQFYGTVIHNAKAVYQKYLGWYNSNPVDLNKLLPETSAKKYVKYMGGEDAVLTKAKKDFKKGEYQWVAEITKQLIYANPGNKDAKLLCADALEQLGYVSESGTWRNEYLMGAQELRYGIIPARSSIISTDVLNNLPMGDILNLLSIRIDGVKAGDYDYKINFIIPDRGEQASTEVKRGIFRYLGNAPVKDAAVTVTMPKAILYELATTNNKPDDSEITIVGDAGKWDLFLSLQDTIDQNFNIITPVPRLTGT